MFNHTGGATVLRDGTETERVGIRVSPDDKALWQAAADAAGITLSAWLKASCNLAAARVIGRITAHVQSERRAQA